jgi:hypothetical protein
MCQSRRAFLPGQGRQVADIEQWRGVSNVVGNGHELFFETLDNHIMAAAYTVKGDSFVADKPRLWSDKLPSGYAVIQALTAF